MICLKTNKSKIPTKNNLRKIDMDTDGDCPYCRNQLANINHLLRQHLCINV